MPLCFCCRSLTDTDLESDPDEDSSDDGEICDRCGAGHCSVTLIPADGEGLQPRFDAVRIGVAEMVCEAFSSTFYIFEDTFDTVPISMGDVSKSEPGVMECRFQPRRTVDEKLCVAHGVFLREFVEE